MSLATLAAVCDLIAEQEDEEPVHYVCCDEFVAMCGLDLSDARWAYDAAEDQICKLCQYIYGECLPCPVPGCNPIAREEGFR